jgi:HSP20 family protein
MAKIKKTHSQDRLESLQNELDQILGELMDQRQDRFATRKRSFEVQVDVYETPEAIHIRAEAPGMSKDDLAVYLSRDFLVIEGNKQAPYTSDRLRFLNMEREFGSFTREVGIPKPVDGRGCIAKMVLGVLHIILPKISDRRGQRKRIPIVEA